MESHGSPPIWGPSSPATPTAVDALHCKVCGAGL
jgi:hypothetical protein